MSTCSEGYTTRLKLPHWAERSDIPNSKVWHRCRFKPPNCRLARAARVVCAQPGTVVCSQTPLSLASRLLERGGGGGGCCCC